MTARLEFPQAHPHVALVTIDRPEKANSLDPVTLGELAGAWRSIAENDDIRAAVLTGAGDRVFCSGMDMTTTIPASQRLARGERVDPEEFDGLRSVTTALLAGFDLRKPRREDTLTRWKPSCRKYVRISLAQSVPTPLYFGG